jgi:hypothetical protein
MACQTNQFFIICYFFMKLGGLGGLNEVCGIIYETIRYEHYCTLANPVYNASVVLVQPVVVVVVILVSVANTL